MGHTSASAFGERLRVERRAIGDHLLGFDACLTQSFEEVLDLLAVHLSVDQLVSHQPVSLRYGRIHGHKQRQLALVDLVDAQNPGELLDHALLVVFVEAQALGVVVAPAADHRLARSDPEVPRQPLTDPPYGHAVLVDRKDGLFANTLGVDGVWPEKRRPGAEVPLTAAAVMDADGHQQEQRTFQIEVYGRPGCPPHSRCESSTHFATCAATATVDSLYSAGGDIDGRRIRGQGAAPGQMWWFDRP